MARKLPKELTCYCSATALSNLSTSSIFRHILPAEQATYSPSVPKVGCGRV